MIWKTVALISLPLSCVLAGREAIAETASPTFNKDVAPILYKNCVKCHQSGEIAQRVLLTSYDSAKIWAKSIRQKVSTREMPPWPADPTDSVRFRNDPRLSQHDIDMIVAWVDAGALKGDGDTPALPKTEQGWMHPQGREPDLVLSLPKEVHIPANGEIPYIRVLVKVPFDEDKWIVASQTRPGNSAVVHHMAITEIALNDGMTPEKFEEVTAVAKKLGIANDLAAARPAVTLPPDVGGLDMLGVYTPGSTFEAYGDGSAKLLRGGKNMYLAFNMHYQATGKPETDRSSIALWFQSEPPKHELFRESASGGTILTNGQELFTDTPGIKAEGTRVAIPPIRPNEENYELIGIKAYPEPVTIYQLQPHAHHRARDFKYAIVYPDGREQTILSVPHYDFRWQMAYELETPLHLPAGSKLIVTAHYDNSTHNMHNPAPEKEVKFRDQNQSWDEMFTPFVQYTVDSQDLTAIATQTPTSKEPMPFAEVVGCLTQSSDGKWVLTNATNAEFSESQSNSSRAVKAAEDKALGKETYQLIGEEVFSPAKHLSEKVAVKGLLIKIGDENRINITSLQTIAPTCMQTESKAINNNKK
jgi:hypothetical protein